MGEKRMENFALEQVRPEDRKGWISLAFVQMGMIICVPSLLLACLSLSGNAAVAGILEHIQMFLSLLSYVLSAVGGIMTADYWIVGRGRPEHWHELQGWNRTGVTAAVLAIAAVALIGVDYTGLAWGFLIYLALERLWPSASRTQRNVAEKYAERNFEEDKEGNEEKYGGEE